MGDESWPSVGPFQSQTVALVATLPIANGISGSARDALPIANGGLNRHPSPLVSSGPNQGSGHCLQMARRPGARPCGWPSTVAYAPTSGHPPGASGFRDDSTRAHPNRAMSRSGSGSRPSRFRFIFA